MSDIDDDLKDLLDQLDDDGVVPAAPDSSTRSNSDTATESQADENISREPSGDVLRPVEDVRSVIVNDISDNEPVVVDIARYLDKMEGVADEVLQACRSDRQEAQEVINMLRGQCEQAHARNQPPARMYVDGLVKSVEVKANINTNAVKVMEGVAKMIAATRAGLNIQNNNVSVSTAELDEILSATEMNSELD